MQPLRTQSVFEIEDSLRAAEDFNKKEFFLSSACRYVFKNFISEESSLLAITAAYRYHSAVADRLETVAIRQCLLVADFIRRAS